MQAIEPFSVRSWPVATPSWATAARRRSPTATAGLRRGRLSQRSVGRCLGYAPHSAADMNIDGPLSTRVDIPTPHEMD
jgi:hypothetical protein